MTFIKFIHSKKYYLFVIVAFVVVPYIYNTLTKPSISDLTTDTDIIYLEADDPRVLEAKNQAQQSTDSFIEQLNSKQPLYTYSVKTVLGEAEHIWVQVSSYDKSTQQFDGRIANDPAMKGYEMGDEIKVNRATVEDWTIRDKDWNIIAGGFSIKLLKSEMNK